MESRESKRIKISETEEVKVEKESEPAKRLTISDIEDRFSGTYLSKMKFSSFEPMIKQDRKKCPKCSAMRMYYCYGCHIPLVKGTPSLKLPIDFLVVKHPKEKMGKSSIIASKVLAPDNVQIHNSLEPPEFDYDRTIFLFPGPDSTPITSMSKEDLVDINKVVLLDSTWT